MSPNRIQSFLTRGRFAGSPVACATVPATAAATPASSFQQQVYELAYLAARKQVARRQQLRWSPAKAHQWN